MPFKKSNKFYEENILIKDKIESLPAGAICLVGLLYMEYRIKYYRKNRPNIKEHCDSCVAQMFKEVRFNANFEGFCFTKAEFCYKVLREQKTLGWQTIECVIDSFDLQSGKSGNLGYVRKAEVLEVIRLVVEEYYELKVSDILRSL